ncbi:nuclear pore complex protein NUP50A-like [Phoenix dactylifera]|uniref:Nuclear pore complex protein NUP50A-like n=1 Tax=Phoenix dactylifera TaxID=42345 RepID=A0A8B9AQU5_PHODC|nr:nuclear pore complex protein NUP50A-like [Phoenix dactylifera]XP_038986393.1 nuclear pore complex protein NUP50A-like [Phoenix dactylifera]
MGDAESALPSSKKRVAGRQLSKDNPDPDDDAPEPEMGTFERASDEVMATRRIVKVRRQQPATSTGSNPFAGVRLVPPTDSSAKITSPADQPQTGADTTASEEQNSNNEKIGKSGEEDKKIERRAVVNETEGTGENNRKSAEDIADMSAAKSDEEVKSDTKEEVSQPVEMGKEVKNGGKEAEKEAQAAAVEEEGKETEKKAGGDAEKAVGEEIEKEKQENEQKVTTMPAGSFSSFQQLSSSQNAFTGLAGTGFSSSSFSFGSIAKEGSTFGANSGSLFGLTNNGGSSSSLLGTALDASKSDKFSMQEVPIETGEENEKAVFIADAILYEYLDGGWKERGKGELKVNVSLSDAEKARVIMRSRGNYRLILNASLYPDMSLTSMDKRGLTFACANSAGEGKNALTTFALKFKDSSMVEEFRGVVTAHKGKKDPVLKTPENSPKASDD